MHWCALAGMSFHEARGAVPGITHRDPEQADRHAGDSTGLVYTTVRHKPFPPARC